MQLFSHAKDTPDEQHLLPGEVEGVIYPDSTPLDRPRGLSWKRGIFVFAAMCAAAAVAAWIGNYAYTKIVVEPDTELERTIDAIEADVDFNFPALIEVIGLSDADMVTALEDAGNTLVMLEEYDEDPSESNGFDLYRIPSTIPSKTASEYLDTGISNLKRLQAATLLNGSWRYTVYRYLTCAIRLQYADFSVTDADGAIAHALELQGWLTPEVAKELGADQADSTAGADESDSIDTASDAATDAESPEFYVLLEESGEDSNGNIYQTGTIVSGDEHYTFRISTVTMEDMYGLNLPREGMFVGVRLTQVILEN